MYRVRVLGGFALEGLQGGAALSPSGRDGLLALALADPALKSATEGRKVQVSEVLG